MIALVFLDVTHGVIADGVGVIIVVGLVSLIGEGRYLGVLARERVGIKETAGAVDSAVEAVESALAWPVVFRPLRFYMRRNVPFPRHVGGVSGGLHYFRNGADIFAEIPLEAGQVLITHHPANPRLMRVHAGEQRSPCGAAPAGIVKLREPHALVGQGIQSRGANLAAVTADIAPAHVISHGDNDVGTGRLVGLCVGHGQKQAREEIIKTFHPRILPKARSCFKLH